MPYLAVSVYPPGRGPPPQTAHHPAPSSSHGVGGDGTSFDAGFNDTTLNSTATSGAPYSVGSGGDTGDVTGVTSTLGSTTPVDRDGPMDQPDMSLFVSPETRVGGGTSRVEGEDCVTPASTPLRFDAARSQGPSVTAISDASSVLTPGSASVARPGLANGSVLYSSPLARTTRQFVAQGAGEDGGSFDTSYTNTFRDDELELEGGSGEAEVEGATAAHLQPGGVAPVPPAPSSLHLAPDQGAPGSVEGGSGQGQVAVHSGGGTLLSHLEGALAAATEDTRDTDDFSDGDFSGTESYADDFMMGVVAEAPPQAVGGSSVSGGNGSVGGTGSGSGAPPVAFGGPSAPSSARSSPMPVVGAGVSPVPRWHGGAAGIHPDRTVSDAGDSYTTGTFSGTASFAEEDTGVLDLGPTAAQVDAVSSAPVRPANLSDTQGSAAQSYASSFDDSGLDA